MWVQYQLDNFSTIEEVIASEQQVRYYSSQEWCCHYLVCDRTGDCAVIEFLEGERVVHSGDDLPVTALTNSPYEMSIQAWRERSREELAEVQDMVFSLLRFAVAADAVTGFEPTGSDAAVEAAFGTLAQAADYLTVWSIVFDQENLQIHFHSSLNSQVRSIDFGELDFGCGSPVHMLDIHADVAGDISNDLEPYSHEASLDLFAGVLEQLGLGSPRSGLDDYLQQLESYPCADGKPHMVQEPLSISPWVWLVGVAVMVAVGLVVWFGIRKPAEPTAKA
jgi:choloylglycine hydrolase